MTAEARATTYDDCDDDDDDDDYSDDDVVLSLRGGRPAAGRSLDSAEDRFLSVVDYMSYQKRKFKNFVLSILWTAIADSPNRLSVVRGWRPCQEV